MGGNQSDVDVLKTRGVIGSVRPTVGRVVHFVNVVSKVVESKYHYAADVVEVHPNGTLMLFVKDPHLRVASFIDNVEEDQSGILQSTWHWPEQTPPAVRVEKE